MYIILINKLFGEYFLNKISELSLVDEKDILLRKVNLLKNMN